MAQVAESPAETPAPAEARIRAGAFLPPPPERGLAAVGVAHMTFEEWLSLDYQAGLSEWVDGEAAMTRSGRNCRRS